MAQDNLTPEEKLLKIIENPQTERRKSPGVNMGRGVGSKKGQPGITAWLNKIRIDKNTLRNISLKTVSKIVLALSVIFTLFFIFDFVRMGSVATKKLNKLAAEAAAPELKEKKAVNMDVPLVQALNMTKRHNIFSFMPSTPGMAARSSSIPVEIEEIVKNLKLVGIIWSNNPQAIIENTKEQKTYLVNGGDKVSLLDVRRVLRDKVILGKENVEWELR